MAVPLAVDLRHARDIESCTWCHLSDRLVATFGLLAVPQAVVVLWDVPQSRWCMNSNPRMVHRVQLLPAEVQPVAQAGAERSLPCAW